jgi:hypothetical protein
MVLDFRKVSRAELVAGACGIALIVFMIAVNWYAIRESGLIRGPGIPHHRAEGLPRSGFEAFSFLDVYLLIAGLAAIGLPLLRASNRTIPPNLPADLIVGILGAMAVVLILIRLLEPPDLSWVVGGEQVSASEFPRTEVITKIGAWLGLAGAVGIAAGGLAGATRKRLG